MWLQEVTDEQLALLYGRAEALLFPSLYEGFGLPVLEAMHLGCPVVANDIASVREVGDDTVLYADAADPVAFASQIGRALDAGRSDPLVAKARARATTFSWSRSAESLKVAIEAAVKGMSAR